MNNTVRREGALAHLSEAEIVDLVRKSLDELNIPYKNRPGNLCLPALYSAEHLVQIYSWQHIQNVSDSNLRYRQSKLSNPTYIPNLLRDAERSYREKLGICVA